MTDETGVDDPPDLPAALAEAQAATSRLLASIADLGDADVTRMTALPGWTVGHVLTHLARNADGNRGMAEGAAKGEVAEQYPHGAAGRAADIEAGSGRPAAELVADVRTSAAALAHTWQSLPEETWVAPRPAVVGAPAARPDRAEPHP